MTKLESSRAEIKVPTVQLKVVTVDRRQMTQSTFRQLPLLRCDVFTEPVWNCGPDFLYAVADNDDEVSWQGEIGGVNLIYQDLEDSRPDHRVHRLLNGEMIWGHVNYHWTGCGCESRKRFLHLIVEKENTLHRHNLKYEHASALWFSDHEDMIFTRRGPILETDLTLGCIEFEPRHQIFPDRLIEQLYIAT